jgi:hypothetical protein
MASLAAPPESDPQAAALEARLALVEARVARSDSARTRLADTLLKSAIATVLGGIMLFLVERYFPAGWQWIDSFAWFAIVLAAASVGYLRYAQKQAVDRARELTALIDTDRAVPRLKSQPIAHR